MVILKIKQKQMLMPISRFLSNKTQTKPPAYCSHDAATIASLRADPDFAAAYLKAVRDDGDVDEPYLAQRRLVAASITYRLCE
jgi:DNA-binding phage protein